jgi:hypothetical protein
MATPSRNLPSWAQAGVSDGGNDGGTNPNLPSWAQGSGGGGGSVVLGGSSEFAPHAKKKSGGLFGGLRHAAHFVADKSERAAHDIKSFPGGVAQLAEADYAATRQSIEHPWISSKGGFLHPKDPNAADNTAVGPLVHGVLNASKETLKHPARDPFETFLTVGPVLHGAGRVLDEGIAAKTGSRITEKPRYIRQGDDATPLHGSTNPTARLFQAGYDKVLQNALDKNTKGHLASHAEKRIGGAKAESQRIRQHMRAVEADQIERAGAHLGGNVVTRNIRGKSGFSQKKLQQTALRLASENSTGEEAAADMLRRADTSPTPELNHKQAALFQAVHESGMLRQDEHGNVHINAEHFPHLAEVDAKIARGQGRADATAVEYGLRTPEALQARIDAPNRYRAGAEHVEPTPGKRGVVTPALERQRGEVTRLEKLHDRAITKASTLAFKKAGPEEAAIGTKVVGQKGVIGVSGSERAERLGAALSVSREKLDRMENARTNRMEPTGIVGGEGARPGRSYISYETSESKPTGPIASAQGSTVGKPKPYISNNEFRYEAASEGRVPDMTTHLVAKNVRAAVRYVNTDEFRRDVVKTGSDVKRSDREVLVAIPDEAQAKLKEADKIAVGRSTSTEGQIGELAGYHEYLRELIPGLSDPSKDAKAIGTEAPEGYKWVSKNVLGDLAKPIPGATTSIGKTVDSVNAAITAATVYFKLGHVGTRVFTNAATTLIQGSAAPAELGKSVRLWNRLTDTERGRAMSAAGQKGFEALPAEGNTIFARTARVGAKWWARHADAPFRFASIAYEARKAGFKSPKQFRTFLDTLENPHGHDAATIAKVDWVAKRADRAGIAYDRLNSTEKRVLTRGVWFYPWIKGSTLFTGHTIVEHPYKTAVIGAGAQQAEKRQESILGKLPDYENGLIPLSKGRHPYVTDLSTFSPFATGADVIDAARPAAGDPRLREPRGGFHRQPDPRRGRVRAQDQHALLGGAPSDHVPDPGVADPDGVPRTAQEPEKRQYHHTVLNQLARALAGPATPRRINKAAANKAYGYQVKNR